MEKRERGAEVLQRSRGFVSLFFYLFIQHVTVEFEDFSSVERVAGGATGVLLDRM